MPPTPQRRFKQGRKSSEETQAYRRGLRSIDKTEPDQVDPSKTSESSFEEEELPTKTPAVKKRGLFDSTKDYVSENPAVTIATGVAITAIASCVGILFTLNRELGVDGEKLYNLEKNFERLERVLDQQRQDMDALQTENSKIKLDFAVFKSEMNKDIDSLKYADQAALLNKR